MKLKYELEVIEMGDMFCAVPVGDNSGDFRAVIQLNEVGAEIINHLKDCNTPDEVFARLCETYPEDDPSFIKKSLTEFLTRLETEGLLEA